MSGRICIRDIWDLRDKGLAPTGKDNGCIGYCESSTVILSLQVKSVSLSEFSCQNYLPLACFCILTRKIWTGGGGGGNACAYPLYLFTFISSIFYKKYSLKYEIIFNSVRCTTNTMSTSGFEFSNMLSY